MLSILFAIVVVLNHKDYPIYVDGHEVLPGQRLVIKDAYDRKQDSVEVHIDNEIYVLERTKRRLPRRFRIVIE